MEVDSDGNAALETGRAESDEDVYQGRSQGISQTIGQSGALGKYIAKIRDRRDDVVAILYLAVLSALAVGPLLQPGYVLTVDWGFGPDRPFEEYFYGFDVTPWGGMMPAFAAIELADLVLPSWVTQKFILFLTFLVPGLIGAYQLGGRSLASKICAGTVFSINPFTYIHFLLGNWNLLLGYGFLPLAVVSFSTLVSSGGRRNVVWASLATAIVGAFSAHMLAILIIVQSFVLVAHLIASPEVRTNVASTVRSLVVYGVLVGCLTLYWTVPMLVGGILDKLLIVTEADLTAYSARPNQQNMLVTLLGLQGFWQWGYVNPVSNPGMYLLFLPTAFAALLGAAYNIRRPLVLALSLSFIAALVLAWGDNPPFRSLNTALFENVPGFSLFRETHKYTSALVVSYALFVGLAVDAVASRPRSWLPNPKVILTLFIVSTTVAWNWPIWGWSDQIRPTYFPKDWEHARAIIKDSSEDQGYTVFLPWRQFMRYEWLDQTQKTVQTPAKSFFPQPLFVSRNTLLGSIGNQEINRSEQRAIEGILSGSSDLLPDPDISGIARPLALLNIRWILLAKEADFNEYLQILRRDSEIEAVFEGPTIMLFENRLRQSELYAFGLDSSVVEAQASADRYGSAIWRIDGTESPGDVTFVPPNLDSRGWLGAEPSGDGNTLTLTPGKSSTVWYWPFWVNVGSWLVSGVLVLALIAGWARNTRLAWTRNQASV